MSAPTRLLLLEDDSGVRALIEVLVGMEDDLELVGVAASAEEGIALARELQPKLVVLDNQLEGELTGSLAAPAIKAAAPGCKLLLCTALDLPSGQVAELAVDAYLRKDQIAQLVDKLLELRAEL